VLIQQSLRQHGHLLLHKRRIISADEKADDGVHECMGPIINASISETSSKNRHLYRTPLLRLASNLQVYRNTTSPVPLSACPIYCIRCQVFKNFTRGVLILSSSISSNQNLKRSATFIDTTFHRPFDSKRGPDNHYCARPPCCYKCA
jgi:hypothetical protein